MIKKTAGIFALAAMVLTVSCKENASLRIDDETAKEAEMAHAESGKAPVMTFAETEYDFGSIKAGDVVEHTFTFTNEGTADLVVSNAKASCGCTVPSYTQTPVKPGETGEIKVSFNSAGKSGDQHKNVTVTANTEAGSHVLNFTAKVEGNETGIAPRTKTK